MGPCDDSFGIDRADAGPEERPHHPQRCRTRYPASQLSIWKSQGGGYVTVTKGNDRAEIRW